MSINIKNTDAIAKMRRAGQLAASVLEMITPHVKVGVTTSKLNDICHHYIVDELKAIPAPLHYGTPPFPKSICTSVNHEVCHGIPQDKVLKNGDIVNIDVTIIKEGYHGDTSKMFLVGKPSIKAKRLCDITYQCLLLAIAEVKAGQDFNKIGQTIAQYAKENHCSVVKDYCGHGIGTNFHEAPQILHYDAPNYYKEKMQAGMTFTIEPMINLGKAEVKLSNKDHWTVTTKDRSLSAQWEHTILVTKNGCEVLTKRDEEDFSAFF